MTITGPRIAIGLGVVAVLYGVYRSGILGLGSPEVVLASGETVSGKDIRTPLGVLLIAQRQGDTVIFGMKMIDAAGRPIRSLTLPGGRRPDPPKVSVFDPNGKCVYQCTLKYG